MGVGVGVLCCVLCKRVSSTYFERSSRSFLPFVNTQPIHSHTYAHMPHPQRAVWVPQPGGRGLHQHERHELRRREHDDGLGLSRKQPLRPNVCVRVRMGGWLAGCVCASGCILLCGWVGGWVCMLARVCMCVYLECVCCRSLPTVSNDGQQESECITV